MATALAALQGAGYRLRVPSLWRNVLGSLDENQYNREDARLEAANASDCRDGASFPCLDVFRASSRGSTRPLPGNIAGDQASDGISSALVDLDTVPEEWVVLVHHGFFPRAKFNRIIQPSPAPEAQLLEDLSLLASWELPQSDDCATSSTQSATQHQSKSSAPDPVEEALCKAVRAYLADELLPELALSCPLPTIPQQLPLPTIAVPLQQVTLSCPLSTISRQVPESRGTETFISGGVSHCSFSASTRSSSDSRRSQADCSCFAGPVALVFGGRSRTMLGAPHALGAGTREPVRPHTGPKAYGMLEAHSLDDGLEAAEDTDSAVVLPCDS